MTSITIQHVSKLFGKSKAVDDVSLNIHEHELFFLLGSSGCGKTTLLRILAGFYTPDTGTIFFNDQDLTNVPPHKRNTGMVFQNYALWPHMTVLENLTFGLEMHGVDKKTRLTRAQDALERVRMSDYSERFPNQLSGGQQQRVALGRALVLKPRVVLLDEPLSNLDAKLRIEMRALIKEIHQDLGLTMVYVTHDQDEALSMADRIAVMDNGQIRQIGAPREVYNSPGDLFVADFIGETNLIAGTVQHLDGATSTISTPVGDILAGTRDAKVGMDVVCSIRPEHLSVIKSKSAYLSGTVTMNNYYGSHDSYLVRLKDGRTIKVLDQDQGGAEITPGTEVKVYYDPKSVLIFPAQSGVTP